MSKGPGRQIVSTAVDLDPLDRYRDHDEVLACQLSGPKLRRLVRTAVGLSEESIDLLTRISERLRTAEGALPDTAMT